MSLVVASACLAFGPATPVTTSLSDADLTGRWLSEYYNCAAWAGFSQAGFDASDASSPLFMPLDKIAPGTGKATKRYMTLELEADAERLGEGIVRGVLCAGPSWAVATPGGDGARCLPVLGVVEVATGSVILKTSRPAEPDTYGQWPDGYSYYGSITQGTLKLMKDPNFPDAAKRAQPFRALIASGSIELHKVSAIVETDIPAEFRKLAELSIEADSP